ncbi:MAG: hypothetical protein U1G07_04380 [Verrucomicrobiota bacterium]
MTKHTTFKRLSILLPALTLVLAAHAQTTAPPRGERPAPAGVIAANAGPASTLTRFDLDFPGGTPDELVRAIQQQSGKPLNAIVPREHAEVKLPPLKMNSVDVAQLFQALELATSSVIAYTTGLTDYGAGQPNRRMIQQASVSYGFRTQGPPNDSSIWYFYYQKPPVPADEAKTCRFWQLGPYLGPYKVEDITTAVQTGYKLLNEPAPEMNFHKDTKLLIAVGEPSKLSLIDSVLRELAYKPTGSPSASGTNAGGAAEPAKTKF